MKRYLTYSICFISIILINMLVGIEPAVAQGQFTNMGKDFLVTFSSNNGNASTNNALYLELKLVASKETTVKLTFNGNSTTETIVIPANSIYTYHFDTSAKRDLVYSTSSGVKDYKSLHIEANYPITVYALNLYAYTTDATTVLPITNWGKEYILVGSDDCGYTIIANEDNTSVAINGVAGTIELNKNQVYRLDNAAVATRGGKISANKDIAVFSTARCTSEPNAGNCDHVWEQLIPSANFGKEFFVPKAGTLSEQVKVVAVSDNTTLTIRIGAGAPTTKVINTGAMYAIPFTADTYISADKQIGMIAQIGNTPSLASCGTTAAGPGISWVPPIEQNITEAYIAPFYPKQVGVTQIICHYLIIVAKTADKDATTINGATTSSSSWRNHPSGYSALIYEVTDMAYWIRNAKGIVVTAVGIGPAESYYYLAASSARKLDASFYVTNGGTRYHYQDANLEVPFDCGSPFTFEAEIEYELYSAAGRLKWYVDGVEDVSARDMLTWTKSYLSSGNHAVKLVIKDSNGIDEELETTLKVECATDMTPKTATLYEGQTQQMTIALSGTAPTNIVFALSAHTGTTASSTDYSFPTTVTIATGNSDVKFNVLAVTDNIINEPDEVLVLRAYNSEYGELFATITIKDVATAAQKTLTISAAPTTIYENHSVINPTPTQSIVKVSLPVGVTSYSAISNVMLSYATSTATIGTDYTINSGNTLLSNVTIPTTGSVSLVIDALEDKLYEGDEYVNIAATAPTGYTMGTNSVSIKIIDQTSGEIVVATLNDGQEAPTPTSGNFRIRFSKADITTKKAIKVTYTLTGTANDGTGYQLINPTEATIPIDANYIDVEVKPINNYIVEGARTVKITLLSATPI